MTELVTIDDLSTMLETGDEVGVLERLIAQTPEVAPSKSTAAKRKAELQKAIASFDLDRLIALQEKMTTIIDTLTKNEIRLEGGALDESQAYSLMAEHLDEREISELLDVRRDMIREAVFEHFDNTSGPDTNGTLEVPGLEKKFCREGAGHGTPAVDEQRLQSLLGVRWVEVCDEEIIPEQIIPSRISYTLSLEKVLDMARGDAAVLEMLRSCLIPGKLRSPRFVVRNL